MKPNPRTVDGNPGNGDGDTTTVRGLGGRPPRTVVLTGDAGVVGAVVAAIDASAAALWNHAMDAGVTARDGREVLASIDTTLEGYLDASIEARDWTAARRYAAALNLGEGVPE